MWSLLANLLLSLYAVSAMRMRKRPRLALLRKSRAQHNNNVIDAIQVPSLSVKRLHFLWKDVTVHVVIVLQLLYPQAFLRLCF